MILIKHFFKFFNFRLLLFYFKDIFLILPFFLISVVFWTFFIKNNFYNVRINPNSTDVLKNSKVIKKVHYNFMLNWFYWNFFYFFLFFFILKLDFCNFWFNHLKLTNFNYYLIVVIFIISLFILYLSKLLKNSNINYSLDYFSSIINLIIFVPIMFMSNNMYTFLFILELTSLLILYKFSVSRNWFNSVNYNFSRLLPKSYLNMLFFQYWANFFSSMLLMFSIFNLIYIFGSSEWIFLELINSNMSNNLYFSKHLFLMYIWVSFYIGFFLKIGFTPLHLFKIEVYKGIPFISIFFYTTWYFLSFFLYFISIVCNNIFLLRSYFNSVFFLFILLGLFYSLILLFDVNLIKSFFAYSTVVNAMNFIIVLYLIVN